MNDLPPKNNLSVKEVAGYLGVSQQKIYQMVASGAIPSKRIGRVIKISRKEFQKWYDELPSAAEFQD